MTMETRLIIVGILSLLGVVGVVYWTVHERHQGANTCQTDDLKAAQKQLTQNALDIAAYREQLSDANEKLEEAKKLLSLASSAPAPVLLCHKAGPGNLSGISSGQKGGNSTPGTSGQVRPPDFDPSADLLRLSEGYERLYVLPLVDYQNRK